MHNHKVIYRTGIIVLLAVSIMLCPLASAIYSKNLRVYAQGPEYTPDIATVEFEDAGTPVPYSSIDDQFQTATISGNFITIGNNTYPIGARFTDASDIQIGSIQKDFFNEFGHASIQARGAGEYRLIWMTEPNGNKYFMIVKLGDPWFEGSNGFIENYDLLIKYEGKAEDTIKALIGSAGTVIVIDLGLCPETLGLACVKAGFVALLAGIGAFGTGLWYFFHDVLPAMKNVREAFVTVEINTP